MQHLLKTYFHISSTETQFQSLKKKTNRKGSRFQLKLHWQVLLHSFLRTSGERPEMPSTGLIRDLHTYRQVISLLSLDLTTVFPYSAAAQYTPF